MATRERCFSRRWPILALALCLTSSTQCQAPSGASGDGAWNAVPRAVEAAYPAPAAGPGEFAARRAALARAVGGPSIVWIASAGSADPFFQDDDFYYLTGVEIADIALALVVDTDGELADEVLYLPPHSDMWERWNGARLSPGPEAEAATGFRSTAEMHQAAEILTGWDPQTVHVLAAPDFDAPDGGSFVFADDSGRAGPLRRAISQLRLIKSDYEIECLQTAIDITTTGLLNALTEIRPGNFEYQPQGALEGTFLRLGSERPGFPSICGSGPNSVTLHYNANRRQLQPGELIVMDVGAKLQYYCADVTRTVPVDGVFTPRQREIYQIVLDAQTAAAQQARPGMTIKDLDTIARSVIDEAGYGKYFVHSVGHWIGLDVHDVGGGVGIEENALFTIEPGIYLPEENLGVRIEDDYLMTAEGAVKLSTGFPSDIDSIESLMASLR